MLCYINKKHYSIEEQYGIIILAKLPLGLGATISCFALMPNCSTISVQRYAQSYVVIRTSLFPRLLIPHSKTIHEGAHSMTNITIKDIYAGMPDAKDEINTEQTDSFFASFVIPPALPTDDLLSGKKFLVTGYKGTGKTSVLYYLQSKAQEQDTSTCSSFMYFKSDFEEVRRSNMESIGKKLTSIIDISGAIQPDKVEFLHIWRWVFFKKILDDCEENANGLFLKNNEWFKFVETVNKISFSSQNKKVISLSSLSITMQASQVFGISADASAAFNRIAKSEDAFRSLIDVVDQCEQLFKQLTRTDIPYYLFVDEMEAYFGDSELFKRDLTLIRDMIFSIHRINALGKVHIIAAIRSEIIYAMDRFIQTREINKITDGFCVPIRWSYSNTNSYAHPIIRILMKRISVACHVRPQEFRDWFPEQIYGKQTVNYILDNGWNKPRDIVRLLIAAQNDSMHCNETSFSVAAFDTLRKEYSKNSLTEIRQELQALYTSEEIEMVIRLLRGSSRITTAEQIRRMASKGSKARSFWDARSEDILEDFFRVGFWGNVNRKGVRPLWRWNHKGDTGVLVNDDWELAIHSALCSELSITS